jgi:hypothetical protein
VVATCDDGSEVAERAGRLSVLVAMSALVVFPEEETEPGTKAGALALKTPSLGDGEAKSFVEMVDAIASR